MTAGAREDAAERLSRFGTDEPPAPVRVVTAGRVSCLVSNGALRAVMVDGVEVVRGIDYPVRDEGWGTLPVQTVEEAFDAAGNGTHYRRRFKAGDAFRGEFAAQISPDGLTADLTLTALADVCVNRAGFVALHPLDGVVGTPLSVTHPDGTQTETHFPDAISPSQPVFSIAALTHEVAGLRVSLTFSGEVFEMEDQRNWTDASYKTYCRPLGWPRPYAVAAGETITQRIEVRVEGEGQRAIGQASRQAGRVPKITIAAEPALAPLTKADAAVVSGIGFDGVRLRTTAASVDADLQNIAALHLPIDLEVVIPEGHDPDDDLLAVAARMAAANVQPRSVIALPAAYLQSHQPEGPWPAPSPAGAAAAAARAFPDVRRVAGMLTNFTELNRAVPQPPFDALTFGGTAIVHAADDRSVIETLEALPFVYASAHAIAHGKPLECGLFAIGMRSNPYGADVTPNESRRRMEMAREDPRHVGTFAAAFAVGVVAAAAEAGVESLALSMTSGPLGLLTRTGEPTPLTKLLPSLVALSGRPVQVEREGARIALIPDDGDKDAVIANLGGEDLGPSPAAPAPFDVAVTPAGAHPQAVSR